MSDATDFGGKHTICSSWKEVVAFVEGFPPPAVMQDRYGVPVSVGWIFRGQQRASYDLTPKIERIDGHLEWGAREILIESEFKSRAHMHLPPHLLPSGSLGWLATMQHWGVPTRLLDFTHSPFVGLYFAVKSTADDTRLVRLWAISQKAINDRFEEVSIAAMRADVAARASREGKPVESQFAALDPDLFATYRDSMKFKVERDIARVVEALDATGTRRVELHRSGCVSVASPPSFNPRLASQQGVFLVNCAEDLTLGTSLRKMMEGREGWCETADIGIEAVVEIERRLFQMNIHEQSLFPDMLGLAGLIDQRIRLHWG